MATVTRICETWLTFDNVAFTTIVSDAISPSLTILFITCSYLVICFLRGTTVYSWRFQYTVKSILYPSFSLGAFHVAINSSSVVSIRAWRIAYASNQFEWWSTGWQAMPIIVNVFLPTVLKRRISWYVQLQPTIRFNLFRLIDNGGRD